MEDLARRSITGFAETLACLGQTGVGGATEVGTPGVVGARVPWATDNHWVDAAVADAGAELVEPPHCVWSAVVPEDRRESAEIAMPCMGLVLADWQQPSAASVETPSLAVVGINGTSYTVTVRDASVRVLGTTTESLTEGAGTATAFIDLSKAGPVAYGTFSFDVSGVYAASDPDSLDSDSLLGRVVALSVAQLNRN